MVEDKSGEDFLTEPYEAVAPECAHRFKKVPGGMLVCRLCGSSMPSQHHELDTTAGAEFEKKQRRRERIVRDFLDSIWWWR